MVESRPVAGSLELVPMLRLERRLYDLPPGRERFERYIETMTGRGEDLELPLALFNPMAKAHAAAALDGLLELGAEEIARQALLEAKTRLPEARGDLRVALVLVDDRGGGWTNRYFTELTHRMDPSAELRRGWVSVPLWTTESPDGGRVRRAVLRSIFRARFVLQRGPAGRLGQMMEQEGLAAAFSGEARSLDEETASLARSVIDRHRDSDRFPTIFCCLYGDEAARSVGYEGVGLPADAGWDLALREALERTAAPEAALKGPV